ncbi:hypothetical protein ACE6H2_005876 [Prunus campanulata]
MISVHKNNAIVVVIYFKHEGNQIEEAQLEEQVYEQVDDEGTETDDGEGIDIDDGEDIDEEDDIKDPDFGDHREDSPTLVNICSFSSEDEAITNLRRRRRKRMPKGENFSLEIDRRRNPGTIIVIKSELEGDRPRFERLYICLAACKKADLEIANNNGYVFMSDK